MNTRLFILAFLLQFSTVCAQVPTFDWVKQIESTAGGLYITSSATDAQGAIYFCGVLVGTIDADPGNDVASFTDAGFGDIFVMKVDSSGQFLWARQIGQSSYDQPNGLVIDKQGDIVITGFYSMDSTDFDPGAGVHYLFSNGGATSFVLKLNAAGDFIWARQLESLGSNSANSVTVDQAGSISVTGPFDGTVDFDPDTSTVALTSSAATDIYIWKLSSSGTLMWAKQIETGVTQSRSFSVVSSVNNELYIGGLLLGSIDADPGPGVSTISTTGIFGAFYILKLDESGNFMWVRKFDRTDVSATRPCLVTDNRGNVYSAGYFNGTVDFDPGPGVTNLSNTVSSGGSTFLLQLDSAGGLGFARQIGDPGNGEPIALATDSAGTLYVAGTVLSTGDYDPGTAQANLSNSDGRTYLAAYSQQGNYRWAVNFAAGATPASNTKLVAVDAERNVYTMGVYSDSADFDPSPASMMMSGVNPMFIQKVSHATVSGIPNNRNQDRSTVVVDGNTWQFNLCSIGSSQLAVYNELGAPVRTVRLLPGLNTIDMSLLAGGLYIAQLQVGGSVLSAIKIFLVR